ncbi:MAG TPA: hypothetical protein VKP64_07305 [Mycobacteriales bacterium]|nr:hypothetical protein [Mycobacteriales bacterium]
MSVTDEDEATGFVRAAGEGAQQRRRVLHVDERADGYDDERARTGRLGRQAARAASERAVDTLDVDAVLDEGDLASPEAAQGRGQGPLGGVPADDERREEREDRVHQQPAARAQVPVGVVQGEHAVIQ